MRKIYCKRSKKSLAIVLQIVSTETIENNLNPKPLTNKLQHEIQSS